MRPFSLSRSASPTRLTAIAQAVFVTLLWSSSWVLIKVGLRHELPAVTFAGLRYVLAWTCLLPFVLSKAERREELKKLRAADWTQLALLGLFTYTITQSLQYVGLVYLPAAMLSLLLNLTAVFVAFGGILWLRELPTPLQWIGLALTAAGVLLYFLPIQLPQAQWIGILIALGCMFGNVIASLLGREVNREARLSPLMVTFVSMGIGSVLMLGFGLAVQGFGRLSWTDWAIIAWLAVVNTAFAFTLWNNTLRTLTAVESSVINSLMMPQIAILAVVFLSEQLTTKEIIGLVLVGVGVLVVQLQRRVKG